MKKILIIGYFVGMMVLTYISGKAVATYASNTVEVKFRNIERRLSDSEVHERNIIPRDNSYVFEESKIKEIRTKKFFGWKTEIEFLEKPQTYYREY